MKIALMNEFSQASKNPIILKELKSVVEPMGHTVYNTAMVKPLLDKDVPEAYTDENPPVPRSLSSLSIFFNAKYVTILTIAVNISVIATE